MNPGVKNFITKEIDSVFCAKVKQIPLLAKPSGSNV